MIKIERNEMCNGCNGCMNICPVNCIIMKEDFEGFKYPDINYDRCIECRQCLKVCPLIENKKIEFNEPKAYACYNKDEKIRMESSSGGIFTLLAEKILLNGGVIFGAAFDNDFVLKHKYIEETNDLKKFRGSKYLQSEIGNTFNEALDFLKNDRKVLFSGTPCQIAGLKRFLNKKLSKEKYSNLLLVDFICHGVPSPKVWKKYKTEVEGKLKSSLLDVKFRNKNNGWKFFNLSLKFKNKKEQIKSLKDDPYMRAFLTDICLRPSCYECGFKSKSRVSDITMADFWGIENIAPEIDDDKGISLILIHSEQGKRYYKEILNRVISKEVEIDKALEYNSSAIKSVKPHPKRNLYFKKLELLTFNQLHNKYVKLGFRRKIIRNIRYIIGSILRKIRLMAI